MLPVKNYDSIIKGFTKVIKELDVLVADRMKKQEANTMEITRLAKVNDEFRIEIQKADKLNAKLSDLLT